ncbi:MAG: YIP1 family protein [Gaiellaceae bacterium]
MSAPVAQAARTEDELRRGWWLRVPAVLLSPRSVFAAIRDDSEIAARARQEPVAAIAGLAGIAGVLSTPVARHLLNDPAYDGPVVAVWAFIGGAFYAVTLYWILGGCLYAASHGLGSLGSYRRARHVLGFAAAPLALSLLTLWPVRIIVYGSDLFRTGGSDYGRGDALFGAVNLAFISWAVALLVIGVRAVHGWTWGRAAATVAMTAVFPALLVLASVL